jgi:TRAP-type uncharacterized transport system substrate-binding protein
MKTKFRVGFVSFLLIVSLAIIPLSCDFVKPQHRFRLAIPEKEYFYNYMSEHLKPFLERYGYDITIVKAENTVEANRMVATGQADLALVNNHSTTIAVALGSEAGHLRTVLPLTTRLMFAFSREKLPDSVRAWQFFKGKRVGIELMGGETNLTLEHFMSSASIDGINFVEYADNPDVVMFWGTLYGERAAKWLSDGWYPYSFKNNWIEFITLNDPALRPFTLPAIPGESKSIRINTMATDVLLVANESVGENAIYILAQTILQHKVDLLHQDVMYRNISESFNRETLLFPLHQGTTSYLIRNQPTFFERYAESLALGLSIIAVLYGAIQAVQSRLRSRRKERIDKYFLEFLEIRSDKSIAQDARVKKLDDLFQRAVVQMTHEKLEKADFHILSRLIQQDLTMMRFNP